MRLVKCSPMYRDDFGFDKMLNEFFQGSLLPATGEKRGWVPSSDVIEEKDHFLITIDLPGIQKEKIKIFVEEDVLKISGERNGDKSLERAEFKRVERFRGSFERTFRLPEGVESEKVMAEYKDGVLSIRVPKVEETKPRQVAIKVK